MPTKPNRYRSLFPGSKVSPEALRAFKALGLVDVSNGNDTAPSFGNDRGLTVFAGDLSDGEWTALNGKRRYVVTNDEGEAIYSGNSLALVKQHVSRHR